MFILPSVLLLYFKTSSLISWTRKIFQLLPLFLCVDNVLQSNSCMTLWSAVSASWGPHQGFQSREGGSSLPIRPANGLSFSPGLSLCVANLRHTEHWWGKGRGETTLLLSQLKTLNALHFWLENYQKLQISFILGFILHICFHGQG